MESDTLKNYFQLCKKNDYDQIVIIINGSHNPKYANDPQIQAINKLKKYYTEEQVDPVDNLLDLYNKYHVMKGGDTLSSITSFLKKNISMDKIKSAALSSAKVIGSLLKSAAKSVYESAKKDPEGTVKFMRTIHESTTKVLINDVIKSEDTKKTINDSFEKIFDVVLNSLKESTVTPNVTVKQTGGYDNYGSNYLDHNYGHNYKKINNINKSNAKYGSEYINQIYGANYNQIGGDMDDYNQIGGDIDDYISYDDNISQTSDMDNDGMQHNSDINIHNNDINENTYEYQPYEY